jgi:limonene-1,2-epoxide hydrolase
MGGCMGNLIDLVKTFQERVNQHDIEKIMTMFTEDFTLEDVGLSKFSGKQQIKNILEYHAGVNTNVQFINCKSEGNTVHCQMLLRNDAFDAIGIGELKSSSCIFTFKDNLIQRFAAEIPSDFVEHRSKIWKKFISWLTENHPDDYSRMLMPDGSFILSLENGRDLVSLIRKWSEEQKAKE